MNGSRYEPVVTVSASYGTGGRLVAERVAHELGVPFIDRVISADLSQEMARSARSQEGIDEEEKELTPASRFLSYFARAASVGAMMAPEPILDDEDDIREAVERPLQAVMAGEPAVVLGRAGAIVLRDRPRVFHARLDGPVERRVERGAEFENLDLEAARQRLSETDKVRTRFVKRLYRIDPTESSLYHMTLDTTVLSIESAAKVVAYAARAFFEANL